MQLKLSSEPLLYKGKSTAINRETGEVEQNTTLTTGRWVPGIGLPLNEKLEVKVRVKDGLTWSEWSGSGWLTIEKEVEDKAVVVAGNSHSLELDGQGQVWAWGLNNSGQLGTGDTRSQCEKAGRREG